MSIAEHDMMSSKTGGICYQKSEFSVEKIMNTSCFFHRTKSTVFVSFTTPVVTIDEFFGKKIVKNLASFLGILANKIKIAYSVQETSRRKKRASVIEVCSYGIERDHNI